jgi:hypothetical protein
MLRDLKGLFTAESVGQQRDSNSALLTHIHQGEGKAVACAIQAPCSRKGYLQYCRHPGPLSFLGHPYTWGLGTDHSCSITASDWEDLFPGKIWDGCMPWLWPRWHREPPRHTSVENSPRPQQCTLLSAVTGCSIYPTYSQRPQVTSSVHTCKGWEKVTASTRQTPGLL